MAEKKGMSTTTGCLIALLVAVFGGVVVVAIAAAVVVVMGPTWFLEAATEPAPLTSSHEASTDPPLAIRQRLADGLQGETRTARLTGPEITTVLRDQMGSMGQGGVTIADGVATIDLSFDLTEPGAQPMWFNLHARGSLTMEKGWCTAASIEELDVSGWELGPMVAGEEAQLVRSLNQSLANQRAEDPEIGDKLDAIERFTVEGDAVVLTVTPEGVALVSGPH